MSQENQRTAKNKEGSAPDISVIVPVFNAAPYLDQALDSIEAQTHQSLEIICLNDGSTDDSLAILQRHACLDARIVVIDKRNEGYGATCNQGLARARGSYVAIIEPDDWIEPSLFEDMLAFGAGFGQKIDIIKTPYWRITSPDTPQQRKLNCSYKGRIHPSSQPFAVKDAPHLLIHHPSIWSALYRLDFLVEKGIQFKEIPGAGWADNPFLIETLCQTNHIVYLDKAYYCYREETPEKAASFAHANTLLPLARWNDMMDVLERLHVSDESVLRAHIRRGFTYLGGIVGEVGFDCPGVKEAAEQMCSRMDASLVFSEAALSPQDKRLYAQMRNLPAPSLASLPYRIYLIKQGFYNLKNTGLRATLALTVEYLKKRAS